MSGEEPEPGYWLIHRPAGNICAGYRFCPDGAQEHSAASWFHWFSLSAASASWISGRQFESGSRRQLWIAGALADFASFRSALHLSLREQLGWSGAIQQLCRALTWAWHWQAALRTAVASDWWANYLSPPAWAAGAICRFRAPLPDLAVVEGPPTDRRFPQPGAWPRAPARWIIGRDPRTSASDLACWLHFPLEFCRCISRIPLSARTFHRSSFSGQWTVAESSCTVPQFQHRTQTLWADPPVIGRTELPDRICQPSGPACPRPSGKKQFVCCLHHFRHVLAKHCQENLFPSLKICSWWGSGIAKCTLSFQVSCSETQTSLSRAWLKAEPTPAASAESPLL